MSEGQEVVYRCPGCGRPVADDEDYVRAREHPLESGFELHVREANGVVRRFHVEHFRGRLGDRVYELVRDDE
jgi:hypothetical protein